MTGDVILGLLAAAIWLGLLYWSDRNPGARLWPPARGTWHTAAWAWGLTICIYVGQIGVAYDDWNALGWPGWVRHGIGGGLSVVGSAYQSWAVVVLGLKGTSGWPVPLVTTGPYAHMRHPQYLGQVATFVGIAIWAASPLTALVGLAGCLALWRASVTEKRHLARTDPAFAAWAARTPGVLS